MAKLRVDKIAAPIVKDEFTGSVYFDGTGDYLEADLSTDAIGTGEFTIEMWIYPAVTSDTDNRRLIRIGPNNNANNIQILYNAGNSKIEVDQGSNELVNPGTTALSTESWSHVALTRQGTNNLKLFVNGVLDATATTSADISQTTVQIGDDSTLTDKGFTGYISNLRICKGHAVYTGNFTPPTRELEVHLGAKGVVFPAADNRTVLLACQSSTDVTAEATGRHRLTANGDATAADANPGLLRKTNITSTITETTGSVFFDGSGDKLQIADSTDFEFGSNPFTIEFWVYPTAFAATDVLVIKRDGATYAPFYLYINNGTLTFYSSSNGSSWDIASAYSFGHSLTLNVWQHIVLTRNGNEITAYLNGVRGNTITTSASLVDNAHPLGIGGDPGNADSSSMTGYISNLRICKGHAVYKSNFAVPTRELDVHPGPDDDRTVFLGLYDGENIFADKTGRHTIAAYGDRTSSPTPTATDSPIGITTLSPGLTREVDPTAGPTFQGGAGYTSQNWLTLPKGTTTERFPDFGAVDAASARGVFGGGRTPSYLNTIDYITISTTGNAQDFGDLTQARGYIASSSSRTRGVFNGGGVPGAVNTQDFITISSTGDASNFGELQTARYGAGNSSSSTRGVFGGGNPGPSNVIEFITIATTGSTQDFGDLTEARVYIGGCSSSTRGVFGGGSPSPGSNTIDFITISSTGNAVDFGDLTQGGGGVTGCSSPTRGLFAGRISGSDPYTYHDIIDYITIAALGNATDFGDLSVGAYYAAGCSSSILGVFGGLSTSSGVFTNTIDYVTIASTGDAADFGDLSAVRGVAAAVSNGHGGLG